MSDSKGMDAWEAILIGVGVVLLIVALFALVFAVGAAALMWGWGLFMVPVFGLPLLSFEQAIGAIIILSVIRAFTTRGASKSRDEWKATLTRKK